MEASSRKTVIVIVLAAVLTCWGVSIALAQDAPQPAPPAPPPSPSPTPAPTPTPEPSLTIISTSPEPLLVDDMETDKTPVGVSAGTKVCIEDDVYYKTEGERWTFQGWSNGATTDCIAPTRAGTYRASFTHEVLLVVRSAATNFQHSEWVPAGTPVDMEVPSVATVDGDPNSRYRFVQWSDGETPFETKNTIAPVKPTVLEVKWIYEHQVGVDGPPEAQLRGGGWYVDGSNMVLQAPDSLSGKSDGERLKFVRWEPADVPAALINNPTTPQATLKVDAPYRLRAVYQKQFLVTARNPAGVLKRDWVNDGQDLVLETPPVLEIIPDRERLVFKRWDGVDNIASPRFGGPVDRPVNVTAVYDREVMLKVDGQYGVAGDGWQKAGTVASVSVPPSVTTMFLFHSIFTGFTAHPTDQPSISIMMNEPESLTALYRTEIDLQVLAVLLLVPFGAFILLSSYRWVPALWRRRPRLRSRSALTAKEQEIGYATRS
jgi:hypothetical protein